VITVPARRQRMRTSAFIAVIEPTSPADTGTTSLDLAELETRLKVAFLARYGPELGAEVTAEAMAWAWENRTKLEQRTAIVLVHSFQWTYAEVAELLGLPVHTIRNRIHRGLAQLRTDLGVTK